jgi:GT2 family glycosyltransferase
VREGVRACAGHSAVLCYAVGNEIPSPVVRWSGRRATERFLERLYRACKAEDPDALVTYVNYPSTEYVALPFVDFVCFNVYLERPDRLEAYLARLQNLAGDRPLVLAELGLDSRRNGEARQAEVLDWQLRSALGGGCAGVFVFSWTDEWHRGGHDVDDWDFGLVDRERRPKPALAAVAAAFADGPFVPDATWPRMSVVVCTYNGSRTIDDCLDGLARQTYADHEVIVVDDGSTDHTAALVEAWLPRMPRLPPRAHPQRRALERPQRRDARGRGGGALLHRRRRAARPGLAPLHGRGVPPHHARGDGRPERPPARRRARRRGGGERPRRSDPRARGRHARRARPGCNFSVRRSALAAIGGFDATFRVAGDDVDVCWRLQEAGGTIGFCPAAFVWHHRRNSVRTYWRQQKGYGKAEALLEAKWPEKYNAAGHVTWGGRLYGLRLHEALLRRHGRIYHGVWGSAPFQSLYGPSPNGAWSIATMPEWNVITAALAALALLALEWPAFAWAVPLLALSAGAQLTQAWLAAGEATYPSGGRGWDRPRLALLTALLHLAQPVARLTGRVRYGLSPWRWCRWAGFASPLPTTTLVWAEQWAAPESRLATIVEALAAVPAVVGHGGPTDSWDLGVRGGMVGGTRLLLLTEEHGAGRQLVRVRARPRVRPAVVALTAAAARSPAARSSTGRGRRRPRSGWRVCCSCCAPPTSAASRRRWSGARSARRRRRGTRSWSARG